MADEKYILKLYLTGKTASSQRALSNLQDICAHELKNEYDIIVIDILEEPGLAEKEKIIATPTVIKQLPPPMRKIIGDLSDKEKVLLGLGILRSD